MSFAFALGYRLASGLDRHEAMVIGQLRVGHGADRVREMRGVEHRGQPLIQRLNGQLFPDITERGWSSLLACAYWLGKTHR